MKQRIITASVGLIVLFVVLYFYSTVIFDIVICLVSLIAVHEMLLASKCTKNLPLSIVMLSVALLPFTRVLYDVGNRETVFVYTMVTIGIIALQIIIGAIFGFTGKNKISLKRFVFALFSSVFLSWTFYILVLLRNKLDIYHGIYYMMLVFACSWGADSGAYFAGRFFGKHKLAPKISPNKTVEGFYGGVISSVILVGAVSAIYYHVMQLINRPVELNIWLLLFIGIFGAIVGVLGDLSASIVKRRCKIKDFGVIFPGHGGIMDRFDSVVFVLIFMAVVLAVTKTVTF